MLLHFHHRKNRLVLAQEKAMSKAKVNSPVALIFNEVVNNNTKKNPAGD